MERAHWLGQDIEKLNFMCRLRILFRPITEEEFFDAVEEELDKRDQMELESQESNRLKPLLQFFDIFCIFLDFVWNFLDFFRIYVL